MGSIATSKKCWYAMLSALLATVLSIAMAEGLLRWVQPTSKSYMALAPGIRVVFHSTFTPGIAGPAVYQINSVGARGREWAKDRSSELRVLAIGGSTTECLHNDQSRVWTTLLEQKLADKLDGRTAWVGNIGKSGLNSRHHVLQTKHLDAYDPDIVLLLVGVNDLCQRLMMDTNYDPHYLDKELNRDRLLHQAFAVWPNEPYTIAYEDDPWFKQSRVWRLLRTVKLHYQETGYVQDPEGNHLRRWREQRAKGRRRDELPSLDAALDEYARNLHMIIDNVQEYGADLLMMTQPTLWRDDMTPAEEASLWLGGIGDFEHNPTSTYYTAAALARGMAMYNATLLAVCQERGVRCLELDAVIEKTSDNFYDDCHFTDRANHLIADALARELELARGQAYVVSEEGSR